MADASALAPAKVNLFLHVGPVDADGYHPLASLVAFADVGDRISVSPAERLSLTVSGPFAAGLAGEGDNLILRAVRALADAAGLPEPGLAFTLDKRLPIAAGLGGGWRVTRSDCPSTMRRWAMWPPSSAPMVPCVCMPAPPGPKDGETA
jgi:4-diphosphocytidyl-2-C-methyl-D-erythritol kinase